jgi:hypothetical protein
MLTKAGCRPVAIFGLWSAVLVAGLAAAVGKAFIGSSDALSAIFAQAVAGGAVLALVAHAMIPSRSRRAARWWCCPRWQAFCSRFIWLWPSRWFDSGGIHGTVLAIPAPRPVMIGKPVRIPAVSNSATPRLASVIGVV